jgi:type III secretion protein L
MMAVAFTRNGRIIPAEQFGQITEAAQILDTARQAAAKSEAGLEAVRREAWREGYDSGFAQGVRNAAERLSTALGKAESNLRNLEGAIESVVFRSLGMILGSMDANERTNRMIQQAISREMEGRKIVLHVPPEDEESVRQALVGLDERISLKIDPLMASGEIIMETSSGRMHIGLADQITAMIEAFRYG